MGCPGLTREEIEQRAKEALESGKALVRSITKSANEELAKRAPRLGSSLEKPLNDAAKTFTDTMGTIDKRTREDKVALLRAYRTFLESQRDYVEKKLKSLEGR
jgi:hypothetical protein